MPKILVILGRHGKWRATRKYMILFPKTPNETLLIVNVLALYILYCY